MLWTFCAALCDQLLFLLHWNISNYVHSAMFVFFDHFYTKLSVNILSEGFKI